MAELTLYKDTCVDFTVVSNLFIDQYMKDANDAQLKVYLYLIRMLSAGQVTSVSDIADKFNHTEKDVMRSLKYWEKQGVLTLEYDQSKNLSGIRLSDLTNSRVASRQAPASKAITLSVESAAPFAPPAGILIPAQAVAAGSAEISAEVPASQASPYSKPNYTLKQLEELKNREETQQLIFIAEQYLGRLMTNSEMKSLFYISDCLHFSEELIDWLLQYCIGRKNKKDFRYIEKVALNLHQEGIETPEQAERSTGKYDKITYTIMNELGKSSAPTPKELEFIERWTKEYAFSQDIILEACKRTVLSTDKHRFEYAEGILRSWKNANVHHLSDLTRIDETHQKKAMASVKTAPNKFNQFTQNDYDFSDIEKKLISN